MTNRTPLLIVVIISMIMTTLLYAVGMFFISGFVPPPPPELSQADVVAMYRDNHTSIVTGLSMGVVGVGFMLPIFIVGSVFLSETEEGIPYFSIMQGLCALVTVLFSVFPNFIWLTAAFRVDRAPELILLLHDLGYIMFATPSWGFAFQLLCVAVVGLRDKRPQPIMPRWLSYLALWVALGELCTALVPFYVTSGPFAWDGLFSFWIAFFSPMLWCMLLSNVIFMNVMNQKANPVVLSHE